MARRKGGEKLEWDDNPLNFEAKKVRHVIEGFNPNKVTDKYLEMIALDGVFDFPMSAYYEQFINRIFRGSSGTPGKGGPGDAELSRMVLRTAVGEGARLPNTPGAINIPAEILIQLSPEPSKERNKAELARQYIIIRDWVIKNGGKANRGHALSIAWGFLFSVAVKRKPFPIAPLITQGQTNIGAFAQTEKENIEQSGPEKQDLATLRAAIRARDFYGLIRMTKTQDARHAFWAMVLPTSDPDVALQGIRDSAINQMKVDTGFLRENSRAEFNRPDINTAGNLDFFIPEERRMLDPDRYYPDNTSTLADMTMRGLQSWANQQIDSRFIKPELLEILFNIRTNFYPVGDV